MHGTTNPDVNFIFPDSPAGVAYFTDSKEVATYFATMQDFGGLLPGEKATIVHAELKLSNPLIITEETWEDVADSCNINKLQYIAQSFDSIICTNTSDCTYYVLFYSYQLSEIRKEFI